MSVDKNAFDADTKAYLDRKATNETAFNEAIEPVPKSESLGLDHILMASIAISLKRLADSNAALLEQDKKRLRLLEQRESKTDAAVEAAKKGSTALRRMERRHRQL